jgi:hypothetical protein
MTAITFLAQYSFKGNYSVGLLSFRAGETLIATDSNKLDVNGWAYGYLASSTDPTKDLGWFPLSHMRPLQQQNHGRNQSRSETKQQKQLVPHSPDSTHVPIDCGRGREYIYDQSAALSIIEEGEDEEEDGNFVFDWRRIWKGRC